MATGLGELPWLLLAGVDAGVGEGVAWAAAGLCTSLPAGVDVGVGAGVSGADATGAPPASTICTSNWTHYSLEKEALDVYSCISTRYHMHSSWTHMLQG